MSRTPVQTSSSSIHQSAARALFALALAAGVVGCESKAGTGALVGGGGGALIGGLIGSGSHARAGEGALIGAAAGAIGGALIGHAMDEDDKKKARAQEENRTYTDQDYRTNNSYSTNNNAASVNDVITWSQRGTRDEVIIDRIERSNTIYHLTAADENRLRDAGVSENVIRAMRDTGRR